MLMAYFLIMQGAKHIVSIKFNFFSDGFHMMCEEELGDGK